VYVLINCPATNDYFVQTEITIPFYAEAADEEASTQQPSRSVSRSKLAQASILVDAHVFAYVSSKHAVIKHFERWVESRRYPALLIGEPG